MTHENIDPFWIVGFVEGEGCFTTINDHRLLKNGTKRTYVYPRFILVNNDRAILERIRVFFGFGSIHNHIHSKDGHKYDHPSYQFQVVSRPRCRKLVAFFNGKLQTETKKLQFERWKTFVEHRDERRNM